MTMQGLELALTKEARTVTKRKELRFSQITRWSTKELEPRDGEEIHHLPFLRIYFSLKRKA